jgi:hypothetical protein
MPGRVFISCGQATPTERRAAAGIEAWFRERGFEAYVAIQAQTLADVNSGIIEQLKRSDFYVFVDFRRERTFPNPRFQLGQSRKAHPMLEIRAPLQVLPHE